MVCARWVDAVFVGNYFPEFGTNLVATLTTLDVNDLAHGVVWFAVMGAGNERLSTVLSNGGCAQPARFFLRR